MWSNAYNVHKLTQDMKEKKSYLLWLNDITSDWNPDKKWRTPSEWTWVEKQHYTYFECIASLSLSTI